MLLFSSFLWGLNVGNCIQSFIEEYKTCFSHACPQKYIILILIMFFGLVCDWHANEDLSVG
jgi:hypothetical protein